MRSDFPSIYTSFLFSDFPRAFVEYHYLLAIRILHFLKFDVLAERNIFFVELTGI